MLEAKDPAIKLFGTTIPLASDDVIDKEEVSSSDIESDKGDKDADNQEDSSGADEKVSESEEEKILKKADKILACPRCKSTDTKFCYYNNYNVNQPRHFCRNCRRYWTAGGSLRSVPFGAGRRKNKTPASHYESMSSILSHGPYSPTLKKHSKDGNTLASMNSEEKGSKNNGGETRGSLWIDPEIIDD